MIFDAQFIIATWSGANENAEKKNFFFPPTRIQNARFSLRRHVRYHLPAPPSYVARHSTTRACAVLVVAAMMAAVLVLRLLFAEVVSFILALMRLVSYDTYVAFCHVRDDNSTNFETNGIPEGR